jgi:hypothetical protein
MGFTSLLPKITKQIQKLGTEKRERERIRLHGGRARRSLRRGLRRRSRSTTPARKRFWRKPFAEDPFVEKCEGAGAGACGRDEDESGERTTATAMATSPGKRWCWVVRGGAGKWKGAVERNEGAVRAGKWKGAVVEGAVVGSAWVERLARTICTWARRFGLGAFSILNAPRCNIYIQYIYIYTSRLPVRCDDLQQYPWKLSTKKISKILLIVFALRIIFFWFG